MKAKKINFKSESGFTLMELMVVIGVLAILIAILLPQFSGYTAQAQAISAASEAKNALTAGYSYYVSVTAKGTTSAFDSGVAEDKMQTAVKVDPATGSSDRTFTMTSPNAVEYTTKKGNLQFVATLDLTTGAFGNGGKMVCSGDTKVCQALEDEGNLTLQ